MAPEPAVPAVLPTAEAAEALQVLPVGEAGWCLEGSRRSLDPPIFPRLGPGLDLDNGS